MVGVPQDTQVVIRLEKSAYDKLEEQVNSNTLVSSTTTDVEAGFKLGVHHVLSVLRKGFVIGA
ncbi:hypothetical protein CPT_Percy34 [Caulobacter phage Percy]|uniref:Uncharacterized protein n=1 Tax=Caulobacter phage Percy TaxID=1701809 RepID=A0A0M5M7M4_9CAUD|nr:hypothetical protein CPT_Percy34 [Caulobacter phage Percy]ALF01668.1 hypothetical protein CPT_Percy34 [Caulobacter phage Percy]